MAKTDKSKAGGALIRRAVDEVPNCNARPIREASIAFCVLMLVVRKLFMRQAGFIWNTF